MLYATSSSIAIRQINMRQSRICKSNVQQRQISQRQQLIKNINLPSLFCSHRFSDSSSTRDNVGREGGIVRLFFPAFRGLLLFSENQIANLPTGTIDDCSVGGGNTKNDNANPIQEINKPKLNCQPKKVAKRKEMRPKYPSVLEMTG